jgi:predicted phage terminase large subunit-like protein
MAPTLTQEQRSQKSSDDALHLARISPASFAHVVSRGQWVPFEHLIKLNDYLLRVETGEIKRLIVTMPPRHGKSVLISRYLPAWYLGRHPDRDVLLVCYGKELAEDHGDFARQLLTTWGPQVFGVNVTDTAAANWKIADREGMMLSRSIRGEITGRGAHLLIIDDPIKDELDAQSELKRERVWSWWQSTGSTRLQLIGGDAAAVLVQTRWHEDDFAARLKATGEWTTLNLPALAEEDDELGREVGEPLAAELLDREEYKKVKREKGSYFFAAMYQQKPAPAEGVLFKRKHFRYYRTEGLYYALPKEDEDGDRLIDRGFCVVYQTVDTAISDKETADWTVVSTWAATKERDLLLLDVQRRHYEDQELERFLTRANDDHGRPRMFVEKFGAGRSPLAGLKRAGYPVSEIPSEAGTQLNKGTRAHAAVAAYERHAIFHPYPYPDWLEAFEHELVSFPTAKNDDQVDTVAYAARILPSMGFVEEVREPAYKPLGAGIMEEQF